MADLHSLGCLIDINHLSQSLIEHVQSTNIWLLGYLILEQIKLCYGLDML